MSKQRKLFSGVYEVSLRAHGQTVPNHLGWVHFEKPYINQFFMHEGKCWVLAAFSGVPPSGQILLIETTDQTNLISPIEELCNQYKKS